MFKRSVLPTSVLGRLMAGAFLVASVFIVVGWRFVDWQRLAPSDFWTNVYTEFIGVILGGIVVAGLFDGIRRMHAREQWASARDLVIGIFQEEVLFCDSSTTRLREFQCEASLTGAKDLVFWDPFSCGWNSRTGDDRQT